MADGNKRYLGDVFINKENAERQRQFFKDIIESYQYKFGGTFDAATLQGMDASEFATKEQGDKAENALLSPLLVGKSPLLNLEDPQYIYTDGVLLDREDGRLDLISWYNDLEDDNVTDALEAIYNNVSGFQLSLENQIDLKANSSDLQELENLIENSSVTLINDNDEEEKVINAGFVNGLRFIPITSSAYESLPEEDKTNWRNVYIIKDDLPPDYENPLLDLDFSTGYEFRIYNENFQYSNGLSNEWETICSLEELFEGSNFLSIMKDFIEDNQEYIINDESLLDSLEQLSPGSINLAWQGYPFLSSVLHDYFVYDITLNGNKEYVTDTIDSDSFKNVDIDMDQILKDNMIISEEGDSIIEEISDLLDDQTDSLSNINTALSVAQTDIQTLKDNESDLDDLRETLTQLQNNIDSISSNISTLTNKINNLGKYVKYTGTFYNSTSNIYYNDNMKTAFVYMRGTINHKKQNADDWIKIGQLPSKFQPVQGFKAIHSSIVTVYFSTDRTIYLNVRRSDRDATFTLIIGEAFLYR